MLRPLNDKIIIERTDKQAVSAGGIIMPEQAQEKPQRGVVLACGPGGYSEETRKFIPTEVSVGDIVLFSKYAGVETMDGDREVLILREEDILGIEETN